MLLSILTDLNTYSDGQVSSLTNIANPLAGDAPKQRGAA